MRRHIDGLSVSDKVCCKLFTIITLCNRFNSADDRRGPSFYRYEFVNVCIVILLTSNKKARINHWTSVNLRWARLVLGNFKNLSSV